MSLTSLSSSARIAKLDELLGAVSGKVSMIGLKHDASRALQLIAKYGTENQKIKLLAELKGHLKAMAEETYGHYLVVKMLANDTRKGEVKKECLAEFKGHVVKVTTNKNIQTILSLFILPPSYISPLSVLSVALMFVLSGRLASV